MDILNCIKITILCLTLAKAHNSHSHCYPIFQIVTETLSRWSDSMLLLFIHRWRGTAQNEFKFRIFKYACGHSKYVRKSCNIRYCKKLYFKKGSFDPEMLVDPRIYTLSFSVY